MFDSWSKISKVKWIARQVSKRALSRLAELVSALESELNSAGIQPDPREMADFRVEFLAFYLHILERLLGPSLGGTGTRIFLDWMENSIVTEADRMLEYIDSHRLIRKELRSRYTKNESSLCSLVWITTQDGGSPRESVVGIFALLEAERMCGHEGDVVVVKSRLIVAIEAAFIRVLSEKPNVSDLFIDAFGLSRV